ncbi:MAG: GNAT family N-acetyltransferase [Ginsengibacter sp.]
MVSDNPHIHRATAKDAKLLSSLSKVTFFDTFNETCTEEDMSSFIEEYFNEDRLQRELQDEDDFYFIAFSKDVPIGYMRLKYAESSVEIIAKHRAIELNRIYVMKEFHSKKIGAALMTFAFDFASTNNYEMIWLGVWEHNERAKSFYKKFGFIDSGEKHPFPIGKTPQTDDWLYRFIEKS